MQQPDDATEHVTQMHQKLVEEDAMTREEFITGYCANSHISRERFEARRTALPCACGDPSCSGWAAVENNEDSIRSHMELYSPGGRYAEPEQQTQ